MTGMEPAEQARRERGRRWQAGNTFVELAIFLPLWMTIVLGTWLFGYSFYIYNALEEAVREGARYASMVTYNSANSTPTNSYLTAVQNMVVYADPSGAGSPVVPGLSTNNVALTVGFSKGVPTSVSVAINNFVVPSFLGRVTLVNKPSSTFPFVGIFGPP
jgi:Flp pilus assembly protein TadG